MSRIAYVAVVCESAQRPTVAFYVDPTKNRLYQNVSKASVARVGLTIYRLQCKNRAILRPYLLSAAGYVAQIGPNP